MRRLAIFSFSFGAAGPWMERCGCLGRWPWRLPCSPGSLMGANKRGWRCGGEPWAWRRGSSGRRAIRPCSGGLPRRWMTGPSACPGRWRSGPRSVSTAGLCWCGWRRKGLRCPPCCLLTARRRSCAPGTGWRPWPTVPWPTGAGRGRRSPTTPQRGSFSRLRDTAC